MNRRSFVQSAWAALAALFMPWKAKAQGIPCGGFPRGEVRLFIVKSRNPLPPGYFYANYMPVVRPPKVFDFRDIRPQGEIMTRYGGDLLAKGAKYYGRISLKEITEGDYRQLQRQDS
jgi:hypothetical protein